jgi:hypothetical protein
MHTKFLVGKVHGIQIIRQAKRRYRDNIKTNLKKNEMRKRGLDSG